MSEPLTVLIIEDSEDDALLVLRELRRGGFDITWKRVQTAEALQDALANSIWDVIISDYRLTNFDALAALKIVQQSQLDLPFIVVSGMIGEIAAVTAMKAGAHDYLMKDSLMRLPEAVRREVRQFRLYQAAQAQVRVLEQLGQLKDDFLSTVSHELRSPLTNIKMAIQMVKLSLAQQHPDRLNRYIHILEESCAQELSLINNLLDLQRLEAGVQPLELEVVNPNQWLSSVAEPFAVLAQEQQQQLNIDIPTDLPDITTDLSALRRAIVELLHNACKYTPANEQITLVAQANDTTLQVQIKNSGVEIPPEALPRLFEKFYRIASVDRWKHGGTGLGLALVKRLVEHLRGSITVESTNAQVCFTIQLPLKA